jgi:hypothetical protein
MYGSFYCDPINQLVCVSINQCWMYLKIFKEYKIKEAENNFQSTPQW